MGMAEFTLVPDCHFSGVPRSVREMIASASPALWAGGGDGVPERNLLSERALGSSAAGGYRTRRRFGSHAGVNPC